MLILYMRALVQNLLLLGLSYDQTIKQTTSATSDLRLVMMLGVGVLGSRFAAGSSTQLR